MPITSTANQCPECGYHNAGEPLTCGMCGRLFSRPPSATPTPRPALTESLPEPEEFEQSKPLGIPEPWFWMLVGAVAAPVFTLTPILSMMGWFLSSLTHEMGHTVMAWFLGMPAFPAIRLDGHAASLHGEQRALLALAINLALAVCAWKLRKVRAAAIAIGVLAGLYPFAAFVSTTLREVLHLVAGHLGELAFATICFWRTLSGGFRESRLERGLYGMLGWFLVGENVVLCWGLAFSAAARAWYQQNGSFGLTNDYLRVAHEVLGCSLTSVSLAMLLAALVPVPLAWWIWKRMPD